jgi:ElaB/YqjD/DUF883 family membrane-anchored ribosome-binding protein
MAKNQVAASFDDRLEMLKQSVRGLMDFGSERAGTFKTRVVDVKERVISGGNSAAHKVAGAIKEHPFAAIGIAFGIGYIAMRWIRR